MTVYIFYNLLEDLLFLNVNLDEVAPNNTDLRSIEEII